MNHGEYDKPALDEFVAAVKSRLPDGINHSDDRFIRELFHWGFTLHDAVRYAMCWEENNPELEEDIALNRMKLIGEKYPKYLEGKKCL